MRYRRAGYRYCRSSGSTCNLQRISALPSCIDTACWDSIEWDECEVSSVGKARQQQLRRFGDDFIEVVVRRSISVSLDCSR
jgi:hypothetical protein